ncbi:hypothetical protein AGMMS49965_13340 [Bacteroidia bacterium]|nr:hypothetical protein AGMMS49965_13340 [Bacteroidia bacterium]
MKTSNLILVGIVVVVGVVVVATDETGKIGNPFKSMTESVFGYKYNISTENVEAMLMDPTYTKMSIDMIRANCSDIERSANFIAFKKELIKWARENQGHYAATQIQEMLMGSAAAESVLSTIGAGYLGTMSTSGIAVAMYEYLNPGSTTYNEK